MAKLKESAVLAAAAAETASKLNIINQAVEEETSKTEKKKTDEKEKTWMNTTMHPLIRDEIVKQIDECRQNGIEVVILDIPLLYEANWDKFADEVWVVKISRQLQIERIQNRDGLTKEEAISRIDAQMSLEEKAKRADVVIDSSNAPEVTLQLVEKIWNERLL